MRRGRQSAGAGRRRRTQQAGAVGPLALARLAKRFARFRSEHPRGTRYPDELRQAALGLLTEVEPDLLYRACGLSFRQVMAWKDARRVVPAQALEGEAAKVRVFSVVDEQAALDFDPQAAAPELELLLGPWTVTVRLAGDQRVRRGGPCCP
jgi:hypothetical protein